MYIKYNHLWKQIIFRDTCRGVTEFLWLGVHLLTPYFPSPFHSLHSPSLFSGTYFEITDPRWTFAFSGRCRTAERSTARAHRSSGMALSLEKKIGCKTAQSKILSHSAIWLVISVNSKLYKNLEMSRYVIVSKKALKLTVE